MLKTQQHIQELGLDTFISTYNLVANRSKRYPNLVQLCYHQLDTPKNEITNECRGLILDIEDNFKVISYPFYRFSDYSDRSDALLDMESLKFYEKLDGSIISLYHYKGEWNISTKTMPDADGKIYNPNKEIKEEKLFRDYFFDTFKKLGYKFPENTNRTYVFEFMFKNQGIVQKTKESISLLMVRDLSTLEEVNHIEVANEYGWDKVTPIETSSLEEVKTLVRYLDPIICEGYVVCDKNFTRFKIKSPQFDKIAELKINWDGTDERQKMIERDNFRKLCDIIRTNNIDTFIRLEKYTSVVNQWNRVEKAYKKLIHDTHKFVEKIDGLQGKDLGLFLKGKEKYLNGLAFGISQGRIDKNSDTYLEDYFFNMSIKSFEEIIKSIK